MRLRDRDWIDLPAIPALICAGLALYLNIDVWLQLALIATIALIGLLAPTATVYSTIAAIPLVQAPIVIGSSIEVSLLEIGTLVITVSIVLRVFWMAVQGDLQRVQRILGPPSLLAFWLLLVVAALLSIAYMPLTEYRPESLRLFRWVIVEPIGLYIACRYALAHRGSLALGSALIIPATIASIFAVGEVVLNTGSYQADSIVRATGAYRHPNNLALYLERALMIPAAIAALSAIQTRVVFFAVPSVIIGVGVAATFSRGAVVALFAGIAVICLYGSKWRLMAATGGALLFATLAGLVFFRERLTGSESSGFAETRSQLWSDSLAILRDFPVSGVGLDQFRYIRVPRYIDPGGWSERYMSHPHNLLLDSWLSLGAAGLVLLVLAVVGFARFARDISVDGDVASAIQIGGVAALATGLVHGLVDNGFFIPDLAAMTWMLVALASWRPDLVPRASRA